MVRLQLVHVDLVPADVLRLGERVAANVAHKRTVVHSAERFVAQAAVNVDQLVAKLVEISRREFAAWSRGSGIFAGFFTGVVLDVRGGIALVAISLSRLLPFHQQTLLLATPAVVLLRRIPVALPLILAHVVRTHQMLLQRLFMLQHGAANAAHKLTLVLLERRQLGERGVTPRTLEIRIRGRGRPGFRRRSVVLLVVPGARPARTARAGGRVRLVPVRHRWFPLLLGPRTTPAGARHHRRRFLLYLVGLQLGHLFLGGVRRVSPRRSSRESRRPRRWRGTSRRRRFRTELFEHFRREALLIGADLLLEFFVNRDPLGGLGRFPLAVHADVLAAAVILGQLEIVQLFQRFGQLLDGGDFMLLLGVVQTQPAAALEQKLLLHRFAPGSRSGQQKFEKFGKYNLKN
uniref:(northern house mosquito) hypothetical protein n=2 Tax=Culex pipiens TaxID=7175 RepID=A0A8D8A3T1_CULPI